MRRRMSERANKILYMALSLLLAIVLWLYVDNEQGNTTSETYNNIPIEFIGAEDTLPNRNLMITSGADATINLRLSGPRSMISNLSRDDIRVQVNLTDINAEGSYPKNVSIYFPDNVDRTRINIEYQSRSTVTVQVAPLFSKTVAVSPNVVSNATPEGYIYMADLLVLEPSSLTLRGREEDVAKVAVARVTFDMSGATSTLHQELDYELLDSEGNVVPADGIRVSESRVEVTAPVYLFKDLPLTVKFKESPGSMVSDVDWELTDKTITVAGEPRSEERRVGKECL